MILKTLKCGLWGEDFLRPKFKGREVNIGGEDRETDLETRESNNWFERKHLERTPHLTYLVIEVQGG